MRFLYDLLFLVVFLVIWYILVAKLLPKIGVKT